MLEILISLGNRKTDVTKQDVKGHTGEEEEMEDEINEKKRKGREGEEEDVQGRKKKNKQ